MRAIKSDCLFLPPFVPPVPPEESGLGRVQQEWEMHPSWITGMDGLNAYGHWVNAMVLPIAFQWIEEYKPDVYAAVPAELRDDIGVAIAAAFDLVKELPAYQRGLERSAAYEAALADGKWDPSKTNPVWTGVVRKVRAETKATFAEQSSALGDTPVAGEGTGALRAVKSDCFFLPPFGPPVPPEETGIGRTQQDWEMHPAWIAAMEALNTYNHWVNTVVMPIAFQWIEEHKPAVYAMIPAEHKDDVGVVIAAAYKLVKELPAYKTGLERGTAYEAALANGTWDSSRTNPVWTGVVKRVRTETKAAFAEQSSLPADSSEAQVEPEYVRVATF